MTTTGITSGVTNTTVMIITTATTSTPTQSLTATSLPTASPIPAFTSLLGAELMTSISATIAKGSLALTEVGLPKPLIEAKGDVIPSWEGAVGTLT